MRKRMTGFAESQVWYRLASFVLPATKDADQYRRKFMFCMSVFYFDDGYLNTSDISTESAFLFADLGDQFSQ